MADKRSSDKPRSVPKKPPKRPSRDYSNLPQRPITLKQGEKKKRVGMNKKVTPKKAIPRVKKQPANQWLLKGISAEAKQFALDEANRQGVTIGEWVEQLILDHQQPETNEQNKPVELDDPRERDEILEALYAIEQRLDRIEDQRGFWARFWEQVMNQSKQTKV
jgi:hypothetical protein